MFKELIVEEKRLYEHLFGFNIFILTFLILILTFGINYVFIPMIQTALPNISIIEIFYVILFFMGLNFGIFGIYAKQILKYKINNLNFLYNLGDILTFSKRKLFFFVLVKELFFSVCLFILSFSISTIFAYSLVHNHIISFQILSYFYYGIVYFISGFAISFLISILSLYLQTRIKLIHTTKNAVLMMLFLILTIGSILIQLFLLINLVELHFLSLLISIFMFIFSFFMINDVFEIPQWKRKIYVNDFVSDFIDNKNWIKKDTSINEILLSKLINLNFKRTGIFSRTLFSFNFSIIFVLLLVYIFVNYFKVISFTYNFVIFLALLVPSIYNWLTQYLDKSVKDYLPIRDFQIIKPLLKITLKIALTGIIWFLILDIIIFRSGFFMPFLLNIVHYFAFSYYNLNFLVLITNLNTHILFYNWKVIGSFLIITLVPITIGLILDTLQLEIGKLILDFVLIIVGLFMYKSIKKRY